MPDWAAIRAEYIAGGTSYRKLAARYDVSLHTLRKRAEREKWTEMRSRAYAMAGTKSIEQAAEAAATYDSRIYATADKLLDKVSESIEAIDSTDTGSMRQIAAILRDLQDIKGMRSELMRRETEARIAKLRREAEREDSPDERVIEVRFAGGDIEELSE